MKTANSRSDFTSPSSIPDPISAASRPREKEAKRKYANEEIIAIQYLPSVEWREVARRRRSEASEKAKKTFIFSSEAEAREARSERTTTTIKEKSQILNIITRYFHQAQPRNLDRFEDLRCFAVMCEPWQPFPGHRANDSAVSWRFLR